MNKRSPLSLAGKLTVAALLVAVAGIVIQIVSGIDYPMVPPGIVILLVAAGVVAFGPWRWAPVAGVVVGLFLLVGFFASGAAARPLDPSQLGGFVGTWVQYLAVIVAVIVGTTATIQNFRTRREEIAR